MQEIRVDKKVNRLSEGIRKIFFSPGRPTKLTNIPQAWAPMIRKIIRIIVESALTSPGNKDDAIPQLSRKMTNKASGCDAIGQFLWT